MDIKATIHPNAKKPRIEKDLFGGLHIYVNAPPLEGKANEAVIKALTEFLKVKKYQISLIRGRKSKQKVFKINLS